MKSYFLEELRDIDSVRRELSRLLPSSIDPWLLIATDADPVAYFTMGASEDGSFSVQADLSGRHFDGDSAVLDVLRKLQTLVGGVIRDNADKRL